MKILLFTDNHFCSTSSIVRQRGLKYSIRLENQIKSINWIESISKTTECDLVVCLGDFFDKPTLTDEELTALKEIKWNDLPHYFVVGNHESSINGLSFNSTKALECNNIEVIEEPTTKKFNDFELCFLPYIIESDRKSINDYFGKSELKRIILSHNDVKGIQMGPIISKEGFLVEEIEKNCDLFLNGHLHNGTKFCTNGINLGNLTGQNFGEDAFKYNHCAFILDTETLKLESIENPYAFNFYKLDVNFEHDVKVLESIKDNAVLSIKCIDSLSNKLKEELSCFRDKVIECRITTTRDDKSSSTLDIEDLSMDHLSKFVEFCKDRIGTNDVVLKELEEVCK